MQGCAKDGGSTWSDLYRDCFGPTEANCAGGSSCHTSKSSAGGGVGSLIGAVLLTWLGRQAKLQGWLFVAGSSVTAVGLTLMAASSSFALCVALLVISGLGQAAFASLQSTIVVNGVSTEMRGRAMGILALAIGSSPIGALIVGALAGAHGPAFAIGACAAVCLVLVLATAVAIPALAGYTHSCSMIAISSSMVRG